MEENLEKLIIEDYHSGISQAELIRKYNIGYKRLKKIFKLNDIVYKRTLNSYTRNRNIDWNISFFEKESPELAYIAGFIFADGCLTEKKYVNTSTYSLRISLNEKDLNILEYICDCVGLDYSKIAYVPARLGDPQRQISLGHKMLGDLLKPWGIIPQKTYNFIPPRISDEMLPHFLRGWIDGDGTISVRYRKSCFIRLTGNKEALNWFIDNIYRLGYQNKIYKTEWHDGNVWAKIIIQNRQNMYWFKKNLFCDKYFCVKRKWDKIPDLN